MYVCIHNYEIAKTTSLIIIINNYNNSLNLNLKVL